MSLTNDELLNRIRAQTDMIQQAQRQADQAYQTAFSLGAKVENAVANTLSAEAKANATFKSTDTTQKLLKELIQEIKDLREEGEVQQKQIDALHKEVDEFKELVSNKVNQCYQEMQANKGTGNINVHPYFGSPYEVTCGYPNNIFTTTSYDEDGNPTGHTSFMEVDVTMSDDTERKMERVGISDQVMKQLGEAARENGK